MKRVIGIGNALTDMLVNLKTDSVLGRFKLAKGSMSLVDTVLQTEISKSVAGLPYSLSLGGSAGNTIRAMAQLGCKVGFIGKVGPDTRATSSSRPSRTSASSRSSSAERSVRANAFRSSPPTGSGRW